MRNGKDLSTRCNHIFMPPISLALLSLSLSAVIDIIDPVTVTRHTHTQLYLSVIYSKLSLLQVDERSN